MSISKQIPFLSDVWRQVCGSVHCNLLVPENINFIILTNLNRLYHTFVPIVLLHYHSYSFTDIKMQLQLWPFI
jgi:hypothetical protein